MKWPGHDESVSLCVCLLTIAFNREKQPFFLLAIRCGGGGGGEYFGYGPGSGFNFKPCRPLIRTHKTPKATLCLCIGLIVKMEKVIHYQKPRVPSSNTDFKVTHSNGIDYYR